jgi:hypothetical protein
VDAAGSWTRPADEAPSATPAEPAQPASRAIGRTLRLAVARVPRPVWQGLAAFAAYLTAFTAGYGWPLFRHLNTPNLRQYWTDPSFYTWSMSWWPYAVSHGLNPQSTSQINAPQGYDLAWASTTPSVGLLMWPVTAVFGVLVSYNVMLLLLPPVSAWAAFLLARRLTGRFWPSLLAGSVYGFCPYEVLHQWQGQPNLTAIAVFPLLAYLVLRWWEGTLRDRWLVVWAAALMALEFYTFNESFFDMTAVLAGGLVIGWAVAGRAARPRATRFIVFAVLVLAVALALWLAMPSSSRLRLAARWGLGLLAVAAILWDSPTVYGAIDPVPLGYKPPATMHAVNQLPPFITDGMYRQYLRPGETVVIVTYRGNAGMLFQADAGFYFRIAGGFINASVSPQSALPDQVEAVAHPSRRETEAFANYLRSSGVGAIIVEQAWEEPWMRNFSTTLGMHGTSVGGVTVYPVAPWLASQAHSAQAHPA